VLRSGQCSKSESLLVWNKEGPVGPDGKQGPAGPQGATGPKGDTGASGVQGPQGATGPKGDVGASAPTSTTPPPPTQKVGDVGPGGGPIFYVDMDDRYPFEYLEVAPISATEDAANCKIYGFSWSYGHTTSGPFTSEAFGQGQANTATLLSMCGGGGGQSALEAISSQIAEGWFIPSVAEMKELINAEKLRKITLVNSLRGIHNGALLLTSSMVIGAPMSPATPVFYAWYGSSNLNGGATSDDFQANAIRLIRAG
jgi:hypothetical protein